MVVAVLVLVHVVHLTASLVGATGGRDGNRLSSLRHHILDRLDDDDLADHIALSDIVSADKRVALGDGRVRRDRGRRR